MTKQKKKPDSVLKEAWDNMSEDFSRILPASFAEKMGKRKWGWKVVVMVTLLELVVLGAIGKFVYDWLAG
jgi:hypothetical protein